MTVGSQLAEEVRARGWDVTALPREIAAWRDRVSETLAGWGASEWAVHVGRVGVSELLSNVAKHVGAVWPCRLEVVRAGGAVDVRVWDRSPVLPVVSEPAWDSDCGRGLWLLGEMGADLGYAPTGNGKWVWFSCPLAAEQGEEWAG